MSFLLPLFPCVGKYVFTDGVRDPSTRAECVYSLFMWAHSAHFSDSATAIHVHIGSFSVRKLVGKLSNRLVPYG
jgi:hypothetical protein